MRRRSVKVSWGKAMALGLVSSSWSTAVVQLGARLIGRDPKVDWMDVGSVVLRGRALRRRPGRAGVLAGVAVHQVADFAWTTLLLGPMLRRVPPERRRAAVLGSLVPWAAATAAAEYWALLPWLQPLLRVNVPYWTAYAIHQVSALAYPLYLYDGDRTDRRVAAGTLIAMGAGLGALAVLDRRERSGRSPRLPMSEERRDEDRRFLRRMSAHHEQGVRLAAIGAGRAGSRGLRSLSRLMEAQQQAELEIMRGWWRGWFGGDIPVLSAQERNVVPGMPPEVDVEALRSMVPPQVDRRYAELMIVHHIGGLRMAQRVIERGGDPRLRLFARAVTHEQSRQVRQLRRHRRGERGMAAPPPA